MKIKTKLTMGSLLMALVPVIALSITLGWIAIKSSNETIHTLAMEHLVSVRESNKARIEQYFNDIDNHLLTLANDNMIINAMSGFKSAVNELEFQNDSFNVPALKKQLDGFYSGYFLPEYIKRNTRKTVETSKFLDQLDATGSYLQYLYILKNSNPIGRKNALNAANDESQYSALHGDFHPHINDFLNKFGFHDVFLVDSDSGRVVYSVFKELDFATSLINGAFADSGLGIAFQRANSSNKTETFLEDFKPYTPSFDDPESFIATPIFDQGEKIGVLIFQMPIDKINNIMTNNQQWKAVGMGDTGESYIIGSDYKTRSLSRFLIEDKANYLAALTSAGISNRIINDIKIKNTNIGLQPINTPGAKAAISGRTGEQQFSDYRNEPVLSTFAPLNIKGMKWAVLAEIDEAEAFLPAEKLQSKIITTTLIGIALVAIVAVIIGFLFANSTASPMIKIADAMKSISRGGGDLTQRLDESNNDEIADIAHYFNAFVISIQNIVQEISEYSKQLATAAEQVSATAVQTNRNVNDQQLQIEQVATAMNEMAATVLDVAKNASQAAEEAKKGDLETQAGGKVIEDTINAINQLNANISNAAETVSTLEEDGQSIGTVLDVIRSIAEQTNLLALNAAIEAARAGEQGRGFAVVADEVRTLASRTQDSTEEIQSMIEKLQKGTKISAEAMANSVKLADDAVNQAHGGTNALHNITHAITTIDDMTAQIASASEEQSAVAEEINRNITSISDSARSTVVASNESSHAGEEITKLATNLTTIVKQFKY